MKEQQKIEDIAAQELERTKLRELRESEEEADR